MTRVQQVDLFAIARDLTSRESVAVTVAQSCRVGELRQCLLDQHPALGPILQWCRFAVDDAYATDDQWIDSGATVSLIPPVSGG